MDRRDRRKSDQKRVKRIRSFYGNKAKVSKSDIDAMRNDMKSKGRQMMNKKLFISLLIVLILLGGLTYLNYFN